MKLLLSLLLTLSLCTISLSSSKQQQHVSFVMGIMSVAKDRDRRDAMRETWIRNLRHKDDLVAKFVLGRLQPDHKEEIEKEMEEHGDIVVLECEENQHKGKTVLWFEYVHRNLDFDFVVKVDQDVYVWTDELSSHIKALPQKNFYGGHGPLYTSRRYWKRDRFAFFNGGFAILSRDLVGEVARVVSVAKEHQTKESKEKGFVIDTESLRDEHDIDLRGNEDVSLGRIFKARLLKGDLKLNGGKGLDAADFPWSLRNYGPIPNQPTPDEDVSLRTCPWRHSKDLKTAKGYRIYHEMYGGRTNSKKDCRCNCAPLDEILKVAPILKKKLPFHTVDMKDESKKKKKKRALKKKDLKLMNMEDIKSSGNILRVKYHHKTDGIGGHFRMNYPVFAAAELFGLPLQCDNAALFNGHMSKTNPNIGNKLLLGCDENDVSTWSGTVSKSRVEEISFKNWYDVFEDSGGSNSFAVYANRCGEIASKRQEIQRTMKVPTTPSKEMFNPAEKYLLRPAASFLRKGFFANTEPNKIASELWEDKDVECFRVAIHWRTAMWSINGQGVHSTVGEMFNQILSKTILNSNNPPKCVRVALITQRKEDENGQRLVMSSIQKIKKIIGNIKNLDIRVKSYISDSSKSVYDKSTKLGGDPVGALVRDLSLLTTAHLMLCGRSQFTNLAAALQREDGVHVVTTDKDFSTVQQDGPRSNLCQFLPNTVLSKDLRSRLNAARKQENQDPLKAFLEMPSSTKICPDYPGTPVELFSLFGDCDEVDLPRNHRRRRMPGGGGKRRKKSRGNSQKQHATMPRIQMEHHRIGPRPRRRRDEL